MSLGIPPYDPKTHYLDIATKDYYRELLRLRSILKSITHEFWMSKNSVDVDLYMITPSISSPMGPGSDSEGIPIVFGGINSYLADSSQFGFEPIVTNGIDLVHCWLPSLRGEDPDKTHLNQFYNCEAEMAGELSDVKDLVEELMYQISKQLLSHTDLLNSLSRDKEATIKKLEAIVSGSKLETISFDQAAKLLNDHGFGSFVRTTEAGRDITREGELALCNILNSKRPFWIERYDRDRVPFYQKPDPKNPNIVLNADLIAPPLNDLSYGGEIAGCGQRQDSKKEIIESIKRQNLDIGPYQWYADLRELPHYRVTSGFGLGIERYIAWLLNIDDIKFVIPYPRLKGLETLP